MIFSSCSVDPSKVTQHKGSQSVLTTGAETTFKNEATGDDHAFQNNSDDSDNARSSKKNDGGHCKDPVKNEVKKNGEVLEEAKPTVCE